MDGPQGFHLGLGWGSAGVGPTNKVKRPIFRGYVSFWEGKCTCLVGSFETSESQRRRGWDGCKKNCAPCPFGAFFGRSVFLFVNKKSSLQVSIL